MSDARKARAMHRLHVHDVFNYILIKGNNLRRYSLVRALCSLSMNLLYVNNTFWNLRDLTRFKTTTGNNYRYVICVTI